MPSLSVLIDTYNHEKYIGKAIESVLNQTGLAEPPDIVVVDDGSTDGTPGIVAQYAPRVRYLRKENGGQASAFNVGFEATGGDVVAFLDGDDWWSERKLATVSEQFIRFADVGVVGHGIIESYDDGAERHLSPQAPVRFRLRSTADVPVLNQMMAFIGTSRFAARRSVLEQILPMPTLFYGDFYMFTVSTAITEVLVLSDRLTHYRIHAGNFYQYRVKDRERLLRTHGDFSRMVPLLTDRLRQSGLDAETCQLAVEVFAVTAESLRQVLYPTTREEVARLEERALRTAGHRLSGKSRLKLILARQLPPSIYRLILGFYSRLIAARRPRGSTQLSELVVSEWRNLQRE